MIDSIERAVWRDLQGGQVVALVQNPRDDISRGETAVRTDLPERVEYWERSFIVVWKRPVRDGQPSPDNDGHAYATHRVHVNSLGETACYMGHYDQSYQNALKDMLERAHTEIDRPAGVVINEGGVADWTSDNVTIIDFSEYEGRLDNADIDYADIIEIIEVFNRLEKDRTPFPKATLDDMRDVADRAVQRLQKHGFRLVWTERLGIKLFYPDSDEDYGVWISDNDTGAFAVYDPAGTVYHKED